MNMHCRRGARAFTRAEAVTVALLVMVIVPLLAGLRDVHLARGLNVRVTQCANHLRQIGQAAALCYAENNDYGPTRDDGTHVQNMLTWTDVLYDLDYLPSDKLRLCPVDQHPDYPAWRRADAWGFVFQDDFDNEPPRTGIRTSYATNSMMACNFKGDRFEDPSRQVFAMDGWWPWFSSLNAQWLYAQILIGRPLDPLTYFHGQLTLGAWRHDDISTNMLFRDGRVAQMRTHSPNGVEELFNTFDTAKYFTWLPGERTFRFDYERYQGSVPDYRDREPAWMLGPWKRVAQEDLPLDYPEHLSVSWRTQTESWVKFPNDRQ